MKHIYTNPVIDLLFLGEQNDVITTSASLLDWGENGPEQIINYKEFIQNTRG